MKKLLEENETLTQSVNDACPGLPIFKPNFSIFFFYYYCLIVWFMNSQGCIGQSKELFVNKQTVNPMKTLFK